MKTRKQTLILILIALIMSILACTINVGGPAYPTPAIPISTEAVAQLQQTIEAAVVAGAGTGEITLTINETQLTSFLAARLQAQPHPLITNPQAYLRNGQIQIYGTATSGYLVATASIVLTPSINDQGQMVIELTSADFGPLPVPDGLKEAITSLVTEAYTGALGPVATGFRLESITIADGVMTLTGRIR